MPCTARAARVCLKDKYSPSTRDTSNIWLSEQFIQDTFARFCRGQRRYGSHVPGPLEARRRSSKRRATSLSHIAGNVAPVNPAILFTPQPQTGWWSETKQEKKSDSADLSRLPTSWPFNLFGLPSYTPTTPPGTASVKDGTALDPGDDALEKRLAHTIKGTRSCNALRRVIGEGGFHLSQHRNLAGVLLQHVIDGNWPDEELHNFFLAPEFNPPGTSNHLEFLQLQTALGSPQQAIVVNAAFPTAIELGIVGVSDVQAIILSFPDYATRSSSSRDVKEFWLRCLTAINQSNVVNVKDLDTADFMPSWLSKIHGYEVDNPSAQLIWQLRQFQDKSNHELVADVIRRWLLTCKADNLQTLAEISKMLDNLPSSKVLFMVTEGLLKDALKDTAQAPSPDPTFSKALKTVISKQLVTNAAQVSQMDTKAVPSNKLPRAPLPLESWSAVLSSLETRPWLPSVLADSSLTSWFATLQQNTQTLSTRQKLVSSAWTVLSTSNTTNASLYLRSHGLPEMLISHFGFSKEGTPQDAIKHVLDTLDTLPLPAKRGQTRMYMSLLKLNRKRMVNIAAVINAQDSKFTSLIDDKLYQASLKTYPHGLIELAESVNQDMALFEKYATTQLQKSKSTMVTVQRILKHNHRLHFSLSAGWNEHDKHPISNATTVSNFKAPAETRLGGYTNSEIVDMINRFALDIAQSNLLTAKQALVRVQWFYRFLHRHGAPIRPEMVQALWHAGIRRTGGHTSEYVRDWIRHLEFSVLRRYQRPDQHPKSNEASVVAKVPIRTVKMRPMVRRCKFDAGFVARTVKSSSSARRHES